jgi:hypothetical protein
MKNNDRTRTLLEQALPPVGQDQEPSRDLWPELERRIAEAKTAIPARDLNPRPAIPWFDWVLAAGVAIVAVAFPASVPVLLYYL